MEVKNNLKELRLEKGVNQTELASLVGVSRQTIHAIEVSKYTPSVELALKISRTLELNVEEIFSLK
ncbi:MAG: helix-turn-helix transcriptional regulator [Oligoflexia bacterium]|nr:helix-turn-helix transcriptional regulator [Oligoflexia bacterium]